MILFTPDEQLDVCIDVWKMSENAVVDGNQIGSANNELLKIF